MSANGRNTKQVVHLDRRGFTLCGRASDKVRYSIPVLSGAAFICDYWNVWGGKIGPHRECVARAYKLEANTAFGVLMTVVLTTSTPTFRFRYPATHQCYLVPLWCPNDEYQGGTCNGHVAGYMCLGSDEDCENAMVMLPDWGGPCPQKRREVR